MVIFGICPVLQLMLCLTLDNFFCLEVYLSVMFAGGCGDKLLES